MTSVRSWFQRRALSMLFSAPTRLPKSPEVLPYRHNGRYIVPWHTGADRTVYSVLWRMLRTDLTSSHDKVDLPRTDPNWNVIRNPLSYSDDLALTWIGHSSFLIQIGQCNILTDPIFSERASPSQYFGPKRIVPVPCGSLTGLVAALPPIDVVLISHNHYDHLCSSTVDHLHQTFRPTFFVPMGVGAWMHRRGIHEVIEVDWWQSSSSSLSSSARMDVVGLPVQHLTSRSLFDRGATLCLSYMMRFQFGDTVRQIYFAGDTGYRPVPELFDGDENELPSNPVFKQIGERFGPVDLSLIPIGAYSPRWFMSPMHLSPEDAVCVHKDLRSRRSIGMHWGTFFLTDEPADEPPQRLSRAALAQGLDESEFCVMKHGETRLVSLGQKHVAVPERQTVPYSKRDGQRSNTMRMEV